MDEMLEDPEKVARERVEGTTSDAATREEGTPAAEVPPDAGEGAKASDAGPEAYPFPAGGDVEIATVDVGSGKGETWAPLEIGDVIILKKHKGIPKRMVGRRTTVIDAPKDEIDPDDLSEVFVTVKSRDEVNATLVIPLSAAGEIRRGNNTSPEIRG